MKNTLIISLFFLFISQALAQKNINAVVTNIKTNLPLEFVNISINSTIKGTYTSKNGTFSLNNLNAIDTLKISCIGYKTKLVLVENIKDTISLEEFVTELGEVEVKAEYQYEQIGIKKHKVQPRGFYNRYGFIIGTIIKNVPKSYLQSIEVFVKHHQNNPKNILLLRIYDIDSVSGYPKTNLLNERIAVPASKKGWVTIDVSKFWIRVENAVFLGVENLPNPNYYRNEIIEKEFEESMEDVVTIVTGRTKNQDPLSFCIGRSDVVWQITDFEQLFDGKYSFILMIRGNIKY